MHHRFDLLVVGSDDRRVRSIAETDLTLDKAEAHLSLYEPLTQSERVTISMARSGTYYVGERFDEGWDEEEE